MKGTTTQPNLPAIPISRDRARHMGLWVMERFTVCRDCERYTQTTRERICRKCFTAATKLFRLLSS